LKDTALAFNTPASERYVRGQIVRSKFRLHRLTERMNARFMGRENGEDYAAEFLVMLNAWDAAINFLLPHGSKDTSTIDIARFLGWPLGRHADGLRLRPLGWAGAGHEYADRVCSSPIGELQINHAPSPSPLGPP
jgi:hypothetical protein